MSKFFKKSFFSSIIIVSAFLLLFSCSVGLGESVDTEVPKVEITYPPASRAVRDWFYLAGTCSDDKGVDSISVSAENISTNETIVIGTVSPAKDGSWSIKINEKDSDGSYKLKDGTYTFSAVAKDSSKQNSAPNYRTIEIDNTAPVFVIKNPGTTNSSAPASFGSILKVVGAAADDHEIYELSLSVYSSADMSGEPKAVLSENNVDKTDGINVTLARYNPDVEQGLATADELHNNYVKIYNVEGGGDQQFCASVTLKDSAEVWQNPGKSQADSIGNSTEGALYLNDSIYDTLMGKNSKYKLTAADFMRLLNGTFKNSSSDSSENRTASSSGSVIDENTQTEILKILSENLTETQEKPVAFKLNKNANPSYEIMGFAFKSDAISTFGSHKAAKQSSLTFKASAGRDGTSVKPTSLKVYLFGPYDSCTAETLEKIRTEPESFYESSMKEAEEAAKKLMGGGEPSEELVAGLSTARIIKDYSESGESSTETFTESIELPNTITKGKFYAVAASGEDIDGLPLATQNYYGFIGESAGTPPSVSITGFEDGAMLNALEKVVISGTVVSEETEIAGVTYTISVWDGIKSKSVGKIAGDAALSFGGSKLSAGWKIADIQKGSVSLEEGYSSCVPENGERFKYTVTVSGKDSTGLESKDTKSFEIDKKVPEIKINDITPVAKKETDSAGNVSYVVNGKIKFSAVVTDTNLSSVVASVSDSAGNTKELYSGGNSTIDAEVDTTEFADEGKLVFSVTAKDSAGNTAVSKRNDVFVSQKTDVPAVNFTNGTLSSDGISDWSGIANGKNVFGIENNNSANFSLTDDDGIDSVVVSVYDEKGKLIGSDESTVSIESAQLQKQENSENAKETAANPVTYKANGATSYSVSYMLPKLAGKYKIRIEVSDTEYSGAGDANKKWHKVVSEGYILVSEGNISISFVDITNNTCKVMAGENHKVEGTVSLSSIEKLKSLERFAGVKKTGDGWEKAPAASASYPFAAEETDETKKITVEADNGKLKWKNMLSGASIADGEQHFFYKATGVDGNSAEIELICNGDGYVPKIISKTDFENWYTSSSVKLSVLAADVEGSNPSGISKVTYSYKKGGTDFSGELARGNKTYSADGKEDKESGKYYEYSTTVDFSEEGETSGVVIEAEDNVGNPGKAGPFKVKVDTAAPAKTALSIDSGLCKKNTESVQVSYAFSDATSGLSKIEFCTNRNFNSDDKTYKSFKCSGAKDYGTAETPATIEIPLTGLSDGEYKIYARATDDAGNVSGIEETGTFTVDSTSPVVKITSHTKAGTEKNDQSALNNVVTFSGTISDANVDTSKVPELKYYGGEWKNIDIISDSFSCDGQNWSFKFDTSKAPLDTVSRTVAFQVAFTDKAGNTNLLTEEPAVDYEYRFKVDQDADRPVITFSDISNFEGSVVSRSSFKGFVSDDDGDVKGLWYIDSSEYDGSKLPSASDSGKEVNGWKPITVAATTGDWEITLEKEGENSFEFCVIDSVGTVFDTHGDSRGYLKIGNSLQGAPQSIKFTYDKTAPVVKISYAHGTKSSVPNEFSNASSVFGVNEYLYVQAEITENVGLAEKNPLVLELGGVKQDFTLLSEEKKDEKYIYKFSGIPIKGMASGSIQIAVTAKDKAGLEGKGIEQITIDTEAPTIKIVSPTTAVSDAVTSSVTIKGIAQDNASSVSRIQYLIPTVDQANLYKSTGKISSGWKEVGNSGSWEIQFASGAAESSDSLLYYVNAEESGSKLYAVESYGSDSENIWKVPIYFKVSDSCGNEAIRTTTGTTDKDGNPLYVLVDPDGGKPKVWVNSPEENYTTSGIVTVYGGASDDVSVKSVQLQFDANGDGKIDSDDYELINKSDSVWAGTAVKENLQGSGDDWYVLANGTNSWKVPVDTDKIIASSDGKKFIFRVRAYDDDGNTRGWSKEITVKIDNEVPVIKDLKVVQFGKNETADSSTVSGKTPVTEREYLSGMYISHIMEKANGKFYLVGKITDNSCVESVNFEKQTTASSVNNIDLELENVSNNSGAEYNLCVPLKTDESGQINYIIKANDNNKGEATQSVVINIDSTKPGMYTISGAESENIGENLRLKSLGQNLGKDSKNSTVKNSDGYFTFGDTVSEAGSGLAFVVAVFERSGTTGGKRIYNPMKKDTKLALAGNESESSSSGKPYISAEGFAVQSFDVSRDTEDSIKSEKFKESANAAFIQKGGLVRIAGTYCLITDFDSSEGKITISKSVSTSFKKADLIFGQVIDHQIVETFKPDGKVENDDGDGMCETIRQIGASYTWTASVDSTNIPDGPVTIHVVAIDNAGNTNGGSIATKVENNRPRIAKVMLATDLNGNGKFDYDAKAAPVTGDTTDTVNERTADGAAFGEFSFYSGMAEKSVNLSSEVELKSSAFKVIDGLAVLPEFVGGNGDIGYILKTSGSSGSSDYSSAAGGSVTHLTEKTDLESGGKFADKETNLSGVTYKDLISEKGGIVLGSESLKNGGYLSFTFWDSTEETTPGTDSQWAHLKIPVTILSEETETPVPEISPFYWKSKTESSVATDSSGNVLGHIELENDLTSEIISAYGDSDSMKKPKVSGKIKIEGTVKDNVRLGSISAGFEGLFTSSQIASYEKGAWTKSSSLPNGVESVVVEDVYISQEGHEAKFTLVVDTEKLSGVAGKDKKIIISATDWKNNASVAGKAQTTASSKTALYTVDVVPYVTGVGTELSAFYRSASSVYARTSTGRYPLHEDEKITFYGFNLGTNPSIYLAGKILYVDSNEVSLSDIVGGANKATRSIGTAAVSGEFKLTVNSLEAINNMTNNKKEYNQQPNGVNNNILTDDLYADVWQFKNAAEPVNGGANYVTMKINPKTGLPGFSYANSILYFNMPGYNADNKADSWGADNKTVSGNQYSQIPFGMNYGGFSHNSFTFDNYGYSYGAAMCTDTQSAKASAFFQFFSRETPIPYDTMDQNMNYVNCANASRLDSSTVQISDGENGWVTDIDRIQSISMETTHASSEAPSSSTPTYVYMAYYDKSARQVRFRWGTVGAASDNIDGKANSTNNNNFNRVGNSYGLDDIVDSKYTGFAQSNKSDGATRPSSLSDSFVEYSNTNNSGLPIQVVAASGVAGAKSAYKTSTAYGAGQYVSLAIVNKDKINPVAVVAWYDSKNMQLCMAYNENPTSGKNWNYKVVDSNGGINVKIAADYDGGIHFAYYDNKGGSDLKYAYMSSYNDEPQIVSVDSYGSVGAKCTIDLSKNEAGKWVPYIGYQMNAYLGTPLAAKIAYLPDGINGIVPSGVDNKDCYTGDWEISIVPTSNIPNDDLINVGVWRDSDGSARIFGSNANWATGDTAPGQTVSNSVLNVGNPTIVHGNNTANPIIGYGIDTGAIEMAQKK